MRLSLTVFALVVLCVTTSFTQETVREPYTPIQEPVKVFYPPAVTFATKEALATVVSDLQDFRLETDTEFSILRKKLDTILDRLPPETTAPKAAESCEPPPKAPAPKVEPPKPKTHTVDGHSHKCPHCGHVWAHAGGNVSHNCPVCGTYQNIIHQQHVPVQAQVQAFVKPQVATSSGCSGGNCSVSRFFGRRIR